MKTGCVRNVKNDPLVIVRKSYIDICGNYKTAALLSYFVYWHDIKIEMVSKNNKRNKKEERHGDGRTQDTSLFQFHTTEEIRKEMLGVISREAIVEGRKKLVKLGFISEHKNPNPRYKFDNTVHFLVHPERINDSLAVYSKSYGNRKTVSRKSKDNRTETDRISTEIPSEIPSEYLNTLQDEAPHRHGVKSSSPKSVKDNLANYQKGYAENCFLNSLFCAAYEHVFGVDHRAVKNTIVWHPDLIDLYERRRGDVEEVFTEVLTDYKNNKLPNQCNIDYISSSHNWMENIDGSYFN